MSFPKKLACAQKVGFPRSGHILIFTTTDCDSNTYGGFNDSKCQSCPMNSVNQGGYTITGCQCSAGYTESSEGPCTSKNRYILCVCMYLNLMFALRL